MGGDIVFVLNVLIFFCFFLLLLTCNLKYKKKLKEINKKEHSFMFLYGISILILDQLGIRKFIRKKQKNIEIFECLGENQDLYENKKIAIIILIIILANGFSMILGINQLKNKSLVDGKYINRPDYGEGEEEVHLGVQIQEGKDYSEGDINFEVKERQYSEEELEKAFEEGKNYLDRIILGENISKDEIIHPLNFVNSIPNTSIHVSWITDQENIVGIGGEINNSSIVKEGKVVEIIAILEHGKTMVEYSIYLRVMPKRVSPLEKKLQTVKEKIMQADRDSISQERLRLPDTIDDAKLMYDQEKSNEKVYVLVGGIIVAILLYFKMDQELDRKIRKREIELLIDYPEMINKIILLLGAGMTIRMAWGRIISDYRVKIKEGVTPRKYVYEEMLVTWYQLSNGVTETIAFETFGKRVKLYSYLKFSSLLSQNLKKGSSDLLKLLEYEAIEAFEERKELAKRLGEEAQTKLLGPMMLMLLIVLIITVVPAFMTI